jgi:hypothetical protein
LGVGPQNTSFGLLFRRLKLFKKVMPMHFNDQHFGKSRDDVKESDTRITATDRLHYKNHYTSFFYHFFSIKKLYLKWNILFALSFTIFVTGEIDFGFQTVVLRVSVSLLLTWSHACYVECLFDTDTEIYLYHNWLYS